MEELNNQTQEEIQAEINRLEELKKQYELKLESIPKTEEISEEQKLINQQKREERQQKKAEEAKKGKNGCFVVLITFFAIAVFIIILVLINNNKSIPQANNESETQEHDSIYYQEIARRDSIAFQNEYNELINQLNTEIEDTKAFDGKQYYNSINGISQELVLLSLWANLIINNENHDSVEVVNLVKKLKTNLIRIQKAEFPKMRKAYIKISDDKLWELDIDVKGKNNNKSIQFIGGTFAANSNISAYYNELKYVLTQLRFQYVYFYWYEGATDGSYYTTHAAEDSEIITIN